MISISVLPFFPTPYPDETFYSIITRYHKYSGNLNYTHTIYDLFGKVVRNKDWLMPSNLKEFYSVLPSDFLTIDELIYNHTLFPYYAAFKEKSRDLIKRKMIYGSSRDIKALAGIYRSVKLNDFFQLCPECMKNDKEKYGEFYWHRSHQLPGVFVCPIHNILLKRTKMIESYKFIFANDQHILDETPLNTENQSLMFKFAKESTNLLNAGKISEFNNSALRYKYMLRKKGYLTVERIKRHKLIQDFKKFYGNSFLEFVKSPIRGEQGWLNTFPLRDSWQSPIKHILMIIFLFGGVEKFTEIKNEEYRPFGNGPWPCLNPAHKDYGKKVIKDVDITRNTQGRIVGYFKCQCGFIYTRTNLYDNNEYKKSRTNRFGPIWERKLIELLNSGKNIATIARELKVGRDTVIRYTNLIESNYQSERKKNFEYTETRNKRRKEWLRLLGTYDAKKAREKNGSLYLWLNRNDKNWLQEHYHKKKGIFKSQINWEKRDAGIYQEIRYIITNWSKFEEEGPRRVTQHYIGTLMKKNRHIIMQSKYHDKIPLTKNYLENFVETTEDFQVRKIEQVHNELVQKGESISLNMLHRKTGAEYRLIKKYVQSLTD